MGWWAKPGRWARVVPVGMVTAAVAYGLVELWAERLPVAYLNDSSLHAQMARYALGQIRAGHAPIDGWFPYLNLGSPLFLHYQNVGETVVGVVGAVVGANTAYSWSIYLLVSLWPISVYVSARVLGWDRFAAGTAALVSPFLVSVPGVGYEQTSYLFLGYGVYAQLWAMWLLPLAWAYSWRAVRTGRSQLAAVVAVAATAVTHFFTGYLAFMALLTWPFLKPSELGERLRRAGVVAGGALLAIGWVVVPLLLYRPFTSVNELLQNSPSVRSYGAGQVLSWLFSGRLLDSGRLPVVTVMVAVGLWRCIARWRASERARGLVVVWLVMLVAYFGRSSLGPVVDLLPGHADLFLRRFEMGLQLSSLFLAGVGGAALVEIVIVSWRRWVPGGMRRRLEGKGGRAVRGLLAAGIVVVVLSPAWTQLSSYDAADAASVRAQQVADGTTGTELDVVIAAMERLGGGRVYAGLPTNWGAGFLVGQVPVFKYLETKDVDEVGYTLRTASLMSGPEAYFDETNPSDFAIFGVRYLILPVGHPPPVAARELLVDGAFSLWEIPRWSYLQVVSTIAPIVENRTDIATRSAWFLRSRLAGEGLYPTVAYAGAPAAPATATARSPLGSPGRVLSERVDLLEGRATADVVATRSSVVVLKATYDPGWTATVDGSPAATEMVAPALVGVAVPAGSHRVVFRYRAFAYYPELFALAVASLLAIGFSTRIRRAARRLANRRRATPVEPNP